MSRENLIEAEALDQSVWLVLDVRDEADYRAGHWPGAVLVPLRDWEMAGKQAETGLANTAHWDTLIGELGIDGDRPVAVYDEGRMTEAARVWFILRHFGVTASVVDGGWRVIRSRPGFQPDDTVTEPRSVPFQGKRGVGPVGLVTRDDVKAALGTQTRILDARTADEFDGVDMRGNARGGHLPDARRVGHADLLQPDGRLKSAVDIKTILEESGFQPGDRIITHCDGGGRAALAVLAAVEAGYVKVDAYYLSFSDWSKDEACPIASERQSASSD
ncbi:rhodanese family protein [Aurantimonas aggregata]|uniref:Rhodanese family protein n=1 Tax=Aurantimonas aggregata TaxID=2047720 RepID=A0A6L9MC36_9HYPH|nr:rhodanese-like domain-containing protein [Aurantimonas aggregata]NDV85363.1 rhodanese family protein [Aurantimonas aggregata]